MNEMAPETARTHALILAGGQGERLVPLTITRPKPVEHSINDASHFGVVEVDRDLRVVAFEEKPLAPRPLPHRPDMALISMGIYAFRTTTLVRVLLELCDTGRAYDFGCDIIPLLIETHHVYAYEFRDKAQAAPRYWRDIGTLDSYYESSMDLVQTRASFSFQNPSPKGRATISAGAHVVRSVISDGVRVAEGASVEDCVLLPGVTIDKGAQIRRAIVDDRAYIPAEARVGFDSERDRRHYMLTDRGVVVVANQVQSRTTDMFLERTVA